MIKVENITVYNFGGAIRGMRQPMKSHHKSDSRYCPEESRFVIGKNDLDLMHRLYKAGDEHAKFLRQIFICMDVTAPDYYFKEFSTYKIGVTENSTSTMHRIHSKEFTLDDFSYEHLFNRDNCSFVDDENNDYVFYNNEFADTSLDVLEYVIEALNTYRKKFITSKDKKYWWQMIQLLPMSYNYTRTVTMNYQNVINMINQRSNHKLDEWREFCDILKELPYIKEIMY